MPLRAPSLPQAGAAPAGAAAGDSASAATFGAAAGNVATSSPGYLKAVFAELIEKMAHCFGLNSREIGSLLWTEFIK